MFVDLGEMGRTTNYYLERASAGYLLYIMFWLGASEAKRRKGKQIGRCHEIFWRSGPLNSSVGD